MVGLASPAQAYATPTFSDVDVSTPGHAKVTVTTDAPVVAVWLRALPTNTNVAPAVRKATTAGSATFDLETWGVSSAVVVAQACPDSGACETAVVSEPFTPTDVDAVVTWPADDTVGPNDIYTIQVSDLGGGALFTLWGGKRNGVTHMGSGVVPLSSDGSGQIEVLRCSSTATTLCVTKASHSVSVNRVLTPTVANQQLGYLSPADGDLVRPVLHVTEGQDFTFTWKFKRDGSGSPAPLTGTFTGLTADSSGNIRPTIDPAGLTDGYWTLTGTLSYDDPDYGHIASADLVWSAKLDSTDPVIRSMWVSSDTVLPYKDGYRDEVIFRANYGDQEYAKSWIEILDSSGHVLRTGRASESYDVSAFHWNGRDSDGNIVPEGAYHARAWRIDDAGNTVHRNSATVRLVRKKLVDRTFTRRVSAAGSMTDKFVGRCSRLSQPSDRGWSGSLGYYSNAKCHGTTRASIVATVHAARMPRAVSYGFAKVTVYGGAASSAPRSIAYLHHLGVDGVWSNPKMLRPNLGDHPGQTVGGQYYIFPDRYLVWSCFNVKGSRYDIRSFTVRVPYRALVPE